MTLSPRPRVALVLLASVATLLPGLATAQVLPETVGPPGQVAPTDRQVAPTEDAVSIRLVPASQVVAPGDTASFAVEVLDASGQYVPGQTFRLGGDDVGFVDGDYTFTFGDGQSDVTRGPRSSVTYPSERSYTVEVVLRVGNRRYPGTGAVVVVRPPPLPPPVSVAFRIEATPESPRAGQTVRFEAVQTSGPSDLDATFRFLFDDGTESATLDTPEAEHTYAAEREYTVTVDVRDEDPATEITASPLVVDVTPAVVGPTGETRPVGDRAGEGEPEGGGEDVRWWVLVLAGVALGVFVALVARARPRRTDRRRPSRAPRVPPPVLVVTPRLEGAPPRGAIQGGLRVRRELRLRRTERPARGTIHTESHTDPADAH